jgi:glutamate-1-semialdehyde 2,1-aminomutase
MAMPTISNIHPRVLPNIDQSRALLQRARGLIPALTQTLAKGPSQHVSGVAPVYLERADGCRVWDVDGNEFIDMTMAVGPLSLGYAYPEVDRAIRAQLQKGITFSLMHPLEVEVSEMLRDIVPGAERVRFSKTGADVTSAAVRLARAYTGKTKVMCCGYHGWHDWYAGKLARNVGVPRALSELTETFEYNDARDLEERLDDDVACVILEPMIFEQPRDGFLERLRRLCTARGALLIFDEMWTGFRWAIGGAQQAYGVEADLACFSKAMANGMPVSALTGRGDVMDLLDREVFFFTTFGGEALSLAACKATLAELVRLDVPSTLAERGLRFAESYHALTARLGIEYCGLVGHPSRGMFTFAAEIADPLLMKSVVQQELIRRGVLFSGFINLSWAHTDAVLEQLLDAFEGALRVLARAVEQGALAEVLEGEPVEPVFRKTR